MGKIFYLFLGIIVPPITVSIARINPTKGTLVCCIGMVLVLFIVFVVTIIGLLEFVVMFVFVVFVGCGSAVIDIATV
jgi:hypothetical protein